MNEFVFRQKTFQTPKNSKTKTSESNAVTPGYFKRYRTTTIKEVIEEEAIPFDFSTRKKNQIEDIPKPEERKEQPSAVKRNITTVSSDQPQKGAEKEKEKEKTTKKRGRKDDDEPETKMPISKPKTESSSSTISKSQDVKVQTKTSEAPSQSAAPGNLTAHPFVGQLKQSLDAETNRLFNQFSARTAYVADAMQKICQQFLTSVASSPEVLPRHKYKAKLQVKMHEMKQREKALRLLIEKFSQEEERWKEFQQHLQSDEGLREEKEFSVDPYVPETEKFISSSLQQLTMELDQLKPVLKDVEGFQSSSEKFYNTMIAQLRPETFKSYEGSADPKGLIKNITSIA